MGDFATKGSYEPGELAALKALFDHITSQPWFKGNDDTRESFATYLFATFPSDAIDLEIHCAAVETAARAIFSSQFHF